MKITITGHIIGSHYDFMPEGAVSWGFSTYGVDKSSIDMVHAQPHSFEVEVPDTINMVAAQVAALEAAKVAALNEYHANVAKLNERLSKLQAIGCDSIPVADVIEAEA